MKVFRFRFKAFKTRKEVIKTMKRIVIAFVCLSVIAIAFVSAYSLFLAPTLNPKPVLEILDVEFFEEGFKITLRNNRPRPSDNYIPDSLKIRIRGLRIYNSQGQIVDGGDGCFESSLYLEPERTGWVNLLYTKLARIDNVPQGEGWSIIVKGLRVDSGEEIFSNKYYV